MSVSGADRELIDRLVLNRGYSVTDVRQYGQAFGKEWPKSTIYRLVHWIKVRGTSKKSQTGKAPKIQGNREMIDEAMRRTAPHQGKGKRPPETQEKIAKDMGISTRSLQRLLHRERQRIGHNSGA